MGAIRVHHTDVEDGDWDGPTNKARLILGGSEAYYKSAHAWQDPDGDAETKAAYKFIHHFVNGDGDVGAASLRGCIAGIAVLNGGRGGTNIPDGDRQGVYNHLAAHMEDGDMEPPDLRTSPPAPLLKERGEDPPQPGDLTLLYPKGEGEREVRSYPMQELRAEADGELQVPKIKGYAAVFDVLSEVMFGFREKIKAGAFAKSVKESDVRALFNHDANYVLGRTKNGTLVMGEDDHGLKIEITPPDTQWARDLITTIQRGDVDQMSFAFQVERESWDVDQDKNFIRTLEEVVLYDVSPVTYPAYPQTTVSVRNRVKEMAGLCPAPTPQGGDGSEGDQEVDRTIENKKRRIQVAEKAI